MRVDPVSVVYEFLNARQGIAGFVTGDMVGREAEQTTVYLEHSGGFREVRDCMDRADITYQVYSADRADASDLAYKVREALLEEMPGRVVGPVQVLDVAEEVSPRYFPDLTSREHSYLGEVAVFFTEA